MSIAEFFMLTGAICSIACIVIAFLLWLWDDREDYNSSTTKPGNVGGQYRCFDCGAENETDQHKCWNCGN